MLKAADRYALNGINDRVQAALSLYWARQAEDTPNVTRQRRKVLEDARSEDYVAACRRGRETSNA